MKIARKIAALVKRIITLPFCVRGTFYRVGSGLASRCNCLEVVDAVESVDRRLSPPPFGNEGQGTLAQ